MNPDPIVILAARRTPVGAFQGVFAGVTGPQLGAVAIKAALADSGLAAADIEGAHGMRALGGTRAGACPSGGVGRRNTRERTLHYDQ